MSFMTLFCDAAEDMSRSVIFDIPLVGISSGATYLSKDSAIRIESLLAASMPSTSAVGSASAKPLS